MTCKKKELDKMLLEVFQNFDIWKKERHLYKSLTGLFKNQAKNAEFIVYSYSRKKIGKKVDFLTLRCLANRKNDLLKNNKTLIGKIEGIIGDGFKKQKYAYIKFEKYFINLILLGKSDKQVFFGLCLTRENEGQLGHYLEQLSLFSCNIYNHIFKLNELEKEKALVYIDEVSGLYNHRKMNIDIEHLSCKYDKSKDRFAVFFIDIDDFKQVNDIYGHVVGTQLLKDVASSLKSFLRDEDLVYRYGGDEFVIILPNIEEIDVFIIGERILNKIKNEKFKIFDGKEKKICMSISIGVAIYPDHVNSRENIINLADKMMYEAKKSGKGKVCLAKRREKNRQSDKKR